MSDFECCKGLAPEAECPCLKPELVKFATEIERLRAEITDLTGANGLLHAIVSNREEEISDLRAQLASAREALEPFAAVAEHDIGDSETNADIFRPMRVHNRARQLTVGDLRAAALALTDENGK